MTESDARRTMAALSRAKNAYVFVWLLMFAVWFMSRRAGYQFDRIIPRDMCNLVRVGWGVIMVGGLVLSAIIIRRLMRHRANSLGGASATVDTVAEDFVKAKTVAGILLAVPAFGGLFLVMAGHKPMVVNVLMLAFPLLLMVVSLPGQPGMKSFADQVNALAKPQPSDNETEGN